MKRKSQAPPAKLVDVNVVLRAMLPSDRLRPVTQESVDRWFAYFGVRAPRVAAARHWPRPT